MRGQLHTLKTKRSTPPIVGLSVVVYMILAPLSGMPWMCGDVPTTSVEDSQRHSRLLVIVVWALLMKAGEFHTYCSVHDLSPTLWHALDVWRCGGLSEALKALSHCGMGLVNESW